MYVASKRTFFSIINVWDLSLVLMDFDFKVFLGNIPKDILNWM